MSRVAHTTAGTFRADVAESAVPVLVDFYATWCPPCKALSPALDRLAEAYAGRAKVLKVDVDAEPALAGAFRVSAVPTLVLFAGGRPVDRFEGVPSPAALKAALDRATAGPVAA